MKESIPKKIANAFPEYRISEDPGQRCAWIYHNKKIKILWFEEDSKIEIGTLRFSPGITLKSADYLDGKLWEIASREYDLLKKIDSLDLGVKTTHIA